MNAFFSFFLLSAVITSLSADSSPVGMQEQIGEIYSFQNEMQGDIENALKFFDVPGAAIGVIIEDKVILANGYGFKDIDKGLPMDSETLVRIASLTKAFTANIMGQLVDEGRLNWDDPVIKHIPDFKLSDKSFSDQLTIRDLIAHRTGTERHDVYWCVNDVSKDSILPVLAEFESNEEAKKTFHYNNFMYVVAGMIIEKVSGETWEEALATRILKPLEMTKSTPSIIDAAASSNHSLLYADSLGEMLLIPFEDKSVLNPAGGIFSNITDLLKWISFNLRSKEKAGPALLSEATFREMFQVQIPIKAPIEALSDDLIQEGYGLGWFKGSYNGHTAHFHTGHFEGCFTDLCLIPESGIGIVILANNSSGGRYFNASIRNTILDRLLGHGERSWVGKYSQIKAIFDAKMKTAYEKYDKIEQNSLQEQPLQQYAGKYYHAGYGIIEVIANEYLLTFSYGNLAATLKPHMTDRFLTSIPKLRNYGVSSIIDMSFLREEGEISAISVPFEGFRNAKPVLFQKI